jgi:hypothetical protein
MRGGRGREGVRREWVKKWREWGGGVDGERERQREGETERN